MLQLGRKMSLLIVAIPFSASWLLTYFAKNIELVYSTSFIGGFCSAIILLATQVNQSSMGSGGILNISKTEELTKFCSIRSAGLR